MSFCASYPLAASINVSLVEALNASLTNGVKLSLPSFEDQLALSAVLSNLYCSADANSCLGICSNADLAGMVQMTFPRSELLTNVQV